MIWIERLFWILGMLFIAYICFVEGYKRANEYWMKLFGRVIDELARLGVKS